jgi:hypothetical protein
MPKRQPLAAKIVALIYQQPGLTSKRMAYFLGANAAQVRRGLRELCRADVIRHDSVADVYQIITIVCKGESK